MVRSVAAGRQDRTADTQATAIAISGAIDRATQTEIMDRLGKILRRQSEAAIVRAVYDLTPDGGPGVARGWCSATIESIAVRAAVSQRTGERLVPRLIADGVLTDIGPDHPSWPPHMGRQGRLRAPAWGVLDARLRLVDPQLLLPMVAPETDRQGGGHHRQLGGQDRQIGGAFSSGHNKERGRARRLSKQRQLRIVFGQLTQHVSDRIDDNAAHQTLQADRVLGAIASLRDEMMASFSSLKNHSGPSTSPVCPSLPAAPEDVAAPEALRAETDGEQKQKTPELIIGYDWTDAEDRLRRYGVVKARAAVEGARASGWTARQVVELLGDCDAQTIGGVRAWDPGLVFRHVTTADPGQPIDVKPSAEWGRAKFVADRTARPVDPFPAGGGTPLISVTAPESIAEQHAREQAERNRDSEARYAELESAFGSILDSLSEIDRVALAVRAVTAGRLLSMRIYGTAPRACRGALMRQIQAERAASNGGAP